MATQVLLVEDSQVFAKLITDSFSALGADKYEVVHVDRLQDAAAVLGARTFDVALTTLTIPDSDGILSVVGMQREAPDLPILVLMSEEDDALAEDAIRAGAKDYLLKTSCDSHTLRRAVTYAIERQQFDAEKGNVENHDPVTGLPNRTLFADRLEGVIVQASRRSHNFALHFIGIENLKGVSDALGHPAGEELLRGVAARLKELLQKGDILSDFGGEMFVLLQSQLENREVAGQLAEKIIAVLKQPFDIEDKEVPASATIGIAIYPRDGETTEKLFESADQAFRAAREAGAGTWQIFDDGLNGRLRMRKDLEEELRNAIDAAELAVHYQPQIDLKTGKIVSVEALVRWQKSDGVFVAPLEFIPIAELTGLIKPLGRFVLQKSCEELAEWRRTTDAALKVSVNVSPVQVREGGLVAEVVQVLEKTGLPADAVELEIGESALMKMDEAQTRDVMAMLRAKGVGINLDDFGTAYASLDYIQRFPFTKLKVDRSFVNLINVDANATEIVRAIVQLGRAKHLAIVAEGVETAEQRDFLKAEGCDMAQGYYFFRPVPPSEIAGLLRADAQQQGTDRPLEVEAQSSAAS